MTILGQESIAELKDLVTAKDYTLAQLRIAREAFNGFSPADAKDWDDDFTALKRRYTAARTLALMAFGKASVTPIPDEKIPAPIEWDAVIKAIRQDKDHQTKGDLQDLSDRLSAAGGKPDYSNTPQPRKQTDADLEVFKQTDTVIKRGEKLAGETAKDATPWIIGAVVVVLGFLGLTRRY